MMRCHGHLSPVTPNVSIKGPTLEMERLGLVVLGGHERTGNASIKACTLQGVTGDQRGTWDAHILRESGVY
jgi:hypothetical protein